MADITERLRQVCETGCDPDLPYEAAAEIDRLRARVAELEAEVLAEREACAKVCETEALRRTTSLAAMGARGCAEAIRARAGQ